MRQHVLFLCLMISIGLLIGCKTSLSAAEQQYEAKLQFTDELMEKQPATPMPFSMDRFLLDQRNIRLNDPTKMTYLYVTLLDGTWLKITIVGKLTSTSKRLSRQEQLIRVKNPACRDSDSSETCFQTITGQAPDDMAVYGSSEPAKVGMTTAGSLLEFGGFASYIYSEVPLAFENLDKKVVEIRVDASPEKSSEMINALESAKTQFKKEAQ